MGYAQRVSFKVLILSVFNKLNFKNSKGVENAKR